MDIYKQTNTDGTVVSFPSSHLISYSPLWNWKVDLLLAQGTYGSGGTASMTLNETVTSRHEKSYAIA